MVDSQDQPNRAGVRGGKPRSTAGQERILQAAREELAERGFRQLTIEGVAHRARAGKATIYRWWPNKAALLFDALNATQHRYPEFGDTTETRTDLEEEASGVIKYFASQPGGAFLDLVAESRFDDTLASALSEQFVAARRDATKQVISRGVQRGEAREDFDVDTVMDMVWGAIYYRFLVLHDKPDPDYARRLLDQIWPVLTSTTSTDKRSA